jgi:hypothetical protein
MARTYVIVELDGDVVSSQVNDALKAAGLSTCGETTAYAMSDVRTGLEHSFRPDDLCRMCGYHIVDDLNTFDVAFDKSGAGYCHDCWERMTGDHAPPTDDPDTCPDCGVTHAHQFAGDVFTEEQFFSAVGYCPRCHWPEFDAGGAK